MNTKTPILLTLASLSLSLGACDSDVSCKEVVKHAKELMPADMKSSSSDAQMMARCKDSSQEVRQCAMKAKELKDLGACATK